MNTLRISGAAGLFLFALTACYGESPEVQLTSGAYNHSLDNNDNFSPDNQWLVYDTRTDDGGIKMGRTIEKVHVRTKQIVTIYKAPNATDSGPGVGAVSYHPTENKVVMIHGLLNHSPDMPYHFWRRCGMLVDEADPSKPVIADARNVVFPFTAGALRGGTHRHEFSGDGIWLGYTYNDALMADKGKTFNLRTIGVTKLGRPVSIGRDDDGTNFSGAGTSALVVKVTPTPQWGSDEISHAAYDSWIGTHGYRQPDGRLQRARAFLGTVRDGNGDEVVEVFVVDIPDDLTVPGKDGPLAGTKDIMPMPPKGAVQRRITNSSNSPYPGYSGNVRSSPNGSLLACLGKDKRGIDQIVLTSPTSDTRRSLTSFDTPVQSDARWHPYGTHVCFIQSNSLFIKNVDSNAMQQITLPVKDTPFALVWSRDGRTIAYNRSISDSNSGQEFAQVFAVNVSPNELP